MDNKLGDLIQNTLVSIESAVKVGNVVGEPIFTPDGITLIPLSKASFGFGGGGDANGSAKNGFNAGSAAGVKIEPVGFLVVKNGEARMLNVTPNENSSIERALDAVPKIIDKFEHLIG